MKTLSSLKFKKYQKAWRRKNKKIINAKAKENYAKNREKYCKLHKEYYYKNKEKVLTNQHRYYKENPYSSKPKWVRKNKIKSCKRYYWAHAERMRERARAANIKKKIAVMQHYGGDPPVCKCCDEINIKFLTIDHVNGGGRRNREEIKKSGNTFYSWLIKHNFPNDPPLQILCYNCNCARAKNKGICPHMDPTNGQ